MSNNSDFIDIRCECGHAFRVKAVAEGRSVRCPKCKFPNPVRRPDPDEASPSAHLDRETATAFLPDDSFENAILSALGPGSKARDSSTDSDLAIPGDIPGGGKIHENSPGSYRPTPPPQPKTPLHPHATRPESFDLISFIAQIGLVLLFVIALLLLCFTILGTLEVLAGSDYTFDDQYAPGYSANQLRAIREDLAFFKLLVMFIFVQKTFTMMVRALSPKPHLSTPDRRQD